YRLLIRAEQAPNPESRITLDGAVDALGQPRASLDWRLTSLDLRSIRRTLDVLVEEIRRSRIGQVVPTLDAHPWESLVTVGYHHMGTTRMHPDPRYGVVDADCRVHGVANLFICGSSVFPTSGHANPTLTIVALALRLAHRVHTLLE